MHKKQDHALVFKTTFLYKIEKEMQKATKTARRMLLRASFIWFLASACPSA